MHSMGLEVVRQSTQFPSIILNITLRWIILILLIWVPKNFKVSKKTFISKIFPMDTLSVFSKLLRSLSFTIHGNKIWDQDSKHINTSLWMCWGEGKIHFTTQKHQPLTLFGLSKAGTVLSCYSLKQHSGSYF